MPRSPRARLSLKGRALQLLALREQSRVELRQKLLRYVRQHGVDGNRAARSLDQGATTLGLSAPDDGETESFDRAAALAHINRLLDELAAAGHLSEARFAESRARTRSAKFGRQRIEAELRHHGIDVAPSLDAALEASEYERAYALWQRRFGAIGDAGSNGASDGSEALANLKAQAKQARFLLARGFASDVVRRIVRSRS